jgi:hypothetical protein
MVCVEIQHVIFDPGVHGDGAVRGLIGLQGGLKKLPVVELRYLIGKKCAD